MTYLSKADIFGCNDAKTKDVNVPEWGGVVQIRTLTAAEKGRFEQKMVNKTVDYSTVLAEYVAMIVIDENGSNLFSAGDVKKLADKSAAALQRVFDAGQELNQFDAADVEALAKNS